MLETKANQTIYINNINEKIKINELKTSLYAVFCQFGEILDIIAHKNLRMRGQAFVAFKELSSAINALKSMQGFPFHGKPMRIQYAKSDSNCVAKIKGTYIERPKVPKSSEDKKKDKASKEQAKASNQIPPGMPAGPLVQGYMPNVFPSHPSMIPPMVPVTTATVDAPPNSILFLTNLPKETTEVELSMLFCRFPGFKEVRLVPGRHDIAFVEYENEVFSAAAKEALDNFKITPTHSIQITFAKK